MGVTNRELQIINDHEAGVPADDIAAQMGLTVSYVKARIAYLCNGLGRDRNHEQMMLAGSRSLLVAIERARAA